MVRKASSEGVPVWRPCPGRVPPTVCPWLFDQSVMGIVLFCALLQANGAIVEVEPLCVLDFYVHESHQRQGVGKALFEVRGAQQHQAHMVKSRHSMPG